MTIYSFIFYLLAILIVVTTGMAITRRNLVHAVIYLIFSFFGSAMLFYLFGAPFLAVLEVIIYAGAIMVLFLFVVIMMKADTVAERIFDFRQWRRIILKTALATPGEFGQFIFENHWLSIEPVSLLLLVALAGALIIGRRSKRPSAPETTDGEL
ncbi:MAG: NADH-quinone oxidoreductase subunit J family protein [Planctomycetota bacterium]|jgi:NADH-quinone oxidoreductase subunit J